MDYALRTNKLSKKYGDFTALQPLDLEVKRGEILGYLGPNGAGKTTTIRLLLGLIKPTSGRAEIFGIDAQTNKVKAHKRIAYVPGESIFWPSLTGAETLHLLGKVHGQIDTKYQQELIKRFNFDPSKKVRTYSKGNRQKINLIAALSTRADLLIMDEPTTGLDPIMEQAFKQSVLEAKTNGQTVFLSSHILEEAEALCDRVAILRAGKLVELGTLAEMRHLSAVSIVATFDGTPPKVTHIAGVSNANITGHQLTCQVRGPIEPLFRELVAAHPKTLLSREPSLEELFLSLYGDKEVTNQKAE
ncbi:MAG TPA: ABC transporter ATP-binding protein [Verrucomicrobiae bacterium]|jgi:ABC-2 type transport system ATP-binding protein|nr:ABC transporter ATP-binding protein [Verrucomicrobiae bacterium]